MDWLPAGGCWLVQLARWCQLSSCAPAMLWTVKAAPPLSEAFRHSAIAERDELVRRFHAARERADELTAEAAESAAEADRYLRAAREIGELLGLEDQLSLVEAGSELRGQRLREVAEQVLRRNFREGDIVHYKAWASLVVDEGYSIGGKNPAATFLTQIASSNSVTRVGRRTGRYRVRPAA